MDLHGCHTADLVLRWMTEARVAFCLSCVFTRSAILSACEKIAHWQVAMACLRRAWRPGGGYRHAMAAWVTRWKQVVIGCHKHSHDTMSLCHIVAELPLPCLGKTCVTFFGKNLVQVHRADFPLWKSLDCAVRAQDAPGKHGSHFGFSLQSWPK